MDKNNIIVIIGAGPSGLATAKHALDHGFTPFILQKQSEIGGVWNQQTGLTWRSMKTNLSRHSCSFIDFPWDEKSDMFPPTKVMQDYFVRFAKHFDLYKYINFQCCVIEVDFAEGQFQTQHFRVKWQKLDKQKEQIITDKLVIANGMFDRPFIPKLKGLNDFKGQIVHSRDYKDGKQFQNKKVLVIGGSFTGIQLSADVAQHTSKLFHSFRKPFFLMSHFMKINQQQFMPIDLVLLKWINIYGKSCDNDEEARIKKNKVLLSLCKQQQDIKQLHISEQDLKSPLFFAISTLYEEQVRNGQLIPIKGTIQTFKQNSVIFEDGTQSQIDTVILTTGYLTFLDFLSDRIKQKIEYDVKQQRQPTILFQQMLHPDMQNMIFVGVNKGVNIQQCELQARFAISVFAKKAKLPSRQQIQKQLQYQRQYRSLTIQPQFPHDNYVKYGYQLAKMMDPNFDFDKFKKQRPQIYKQLLLLPVIQQANSWTCKDIQKQIQLVKQINEASKTKIK